MVALVCTAVVAFHYAGWIRILKGEPFVWIALDVFALYGFVYYFIISRRARSRGGSGRGRSGSRTPYNAHGANTDKPVWRHIPAHATLLLDTNVLMCPDENIRSWFGFLLHNAAKNDWNIVVTGAVYEEVMHHLKHGNENKSKDARLARNRIELLTDQLGERFSLPKLNKQAILPADAYYADPQLIEYMCTHKRTFLFSFDNDLKIRCKHLMRNKQPNNRVFSEEDFYA